MKNYSLLLGLVVLVSAAVRPALGQDPPEKVVLPEGVVARVHDRDITREDLLERLAERHAPTAMGQEILDLLVEDAVVELEAAAREVTVTDDETRTYLDRVNAKIRFDSGGTKSIEDVFREQGSTEEEFRETARQFLLRQKMARKDLGWKPRPRDPEQRGVELDDLPEHRVKLWLSAVKTRHPVVREGLPPGVLARVGERDIRRRDLSGALERKLPEEKVRAVLDQMVLEMAATRDLAAAGIEIGPAEVEAELARQRREFERRPEVKGSGLTFDQFLRQVRGIGEADLATDTGFRAALGLRHLLSKDITEERLREHWERNRDAYGERAALRFVYLPAQARSPEELDVRVPTFREAYDLALQAKIQILRGAGIGIDPGEGQQPATLAQMMERTAKRFEPDPARQEQAGALVAWTRATVAGHEALEQAVFGDPPGELRGPIRTDLGYYLLTVEERRPAPTFEQIREDLEEDVLRNEVRNYRLQLLGDPAVVYRDRE